MLLSLFWIAKVAQDAAEDDDVVSPRWRNIFGMQ